MKKATMKNGMMMLSVSAGGLAIGGAILASVAFADGEPQAGPVLPLLVGLDSDFLGQPVGDRSRQIPLTPFDLIIRNQDDADLGRETMILIGEVPEGETDSFRFFVASSRDNMDIHTITYQGRGAAGIIWFATQIDEESPVSFTQHLNGIINYDDLDESTTIQIDPPIRIREGNVIVANMWNRGSTVNGLCDIVLHARIPAGTGGDVMMIE